MWRAGRARCADGVCKNTQALLDIQKPEAAGLVRLSDGKLVDVVALKNTLKTNWAEQKSCDAARQCTVEDSPRTLYGGKITVDPTYGLNESGSTGAGSCDATCAKFSSASIAGQCCSCGGVNEKFVRSTFNANMYLCQ